VAGATLSALSALVTKSLIRRSSGGHYDLHELIRQFAEQHLSEQAEEQAASRARHSDYYLGLFAQADGRLRGAAQREALAELSAEMPNFRAAWDWAIKQNEIAPLCQAAATLWYVYELRAWFEEGEKTFQDAAAAIQSRTTGSQPDDDTLAAVYEMRAHAAFFSFRLGNNASAHAALAPSARYLQSSADQFGGMVALWYLGFIFWQLGKFEEARDSFQASLEKARACGARWYVSMVGQFIGIVALDQGDYDRSRQYLAEGLAKAREIGDPTLIAHSLVFLSLAVKALGQMAEAEKYLRESLSLTQESGYRWGIGNTLDGLGLLAQATNPHEARSFFSASCEVFRDIGDPRSLSRVLNHQGYNFLTIGDAGEAQKSFIAVLRMARAGSYLPYTLDALAGLAIIWAASAASERALELASCVLQHPAATHEARTRAEQLRSELALQLTPQQVESAQTRVQLRSLDQVVDQILGA